MSIFKKHEPKPLSPLDTPPKEELRPDNTQSDPVSKAFYDLASEKRREVAREIFDLESAEKVLIGLVMDDGLNNNTPLSEILQKIREKLKDTRRVKEVL